MSLAYNFECDDQVHKTRLENKHKLPILIVLHQATSSAGRIGCLLQQMGFALDIRRPPLGDKLPPTLAHHSGVIIFGGTMSANDDYDYLHYEIDWIDIPLLENKPFLGICLGAQLLTRYIGGVIRPHKEQLVEVGWYPMEATSIGQKLFNWPKMVYEFHVEGCYDLPREAQLLASSATYPNQAFRYGENAWGIQFHAEFTRIMMQRWVVHGANLFNQKGAQQGRDHLAGRQLYDHAVVVWLKQALNKIFQSAALAKKIS